MGVEPAVAAPPGNPRFPLVDSLRGLSCMAVILAHTAHIDNAYQRFWFGQYTERLMWAVTLFFMISAFLLYRPFVAARLDGTRTAPALGDYARRRFLRVVPGYWVALTICWILFGLPGMDHWWSYYTLTQVYGPPLWSLGGISPAWTLSCEIVFYLVLPLIVLFMRRPAFGGTREQRFRAELGLVALFATVGIAFRLFFNEPAQGALARTLLATADWFAIGMGLAVVSAYLAGRRRQPRWVHFIARNPGLCWLTALVLFVIVSEIPAPTPIDFVESRQAALQDVLTHVLFGGIGLLLILPAVFGQKAGGVTRKVLANRGLAWLGLVAYGIYLYHFPILDALWKWQGKELDGDGFVPLLIGTVLLATGAGAASYYVVERPFLKLKNVRLFNGRGSKAEPVRG